MRKKLSDIALNITEPEYRKMPELSYSMLSRFQSVGYDITKLEEKQESPSLRFGSQVDTLLTEKDAEKSYREHYFVAQIPKLKQEHEERVKNLYKLCGTEHAVIADIPQENLNQFLMTTGFWADPKYKMETRLKKFLEQPVEQYYSALSQAGGRIIIPYEEYERVIACVTALRTSPATEMYFNEPKDDDIEIYYQLKMVANLNGIDYRCMYDVIVVIHSKKLIIPVDLKTSLSCEEKDFYRNFVKYHYQLQSRLYVRILEQNLRNDDYFKDFKILNYRFAFCNAVSVNPLVWEFEDTFKKGTLYYGKNKTIVMPDPEDLGLALREFLDTNAVPAMPEVRLRNSLVKFLNLM